MSEIVEQWCPQCVRTTPSEALDRASVVTNALARIDEKTRRHIDHRCANGYSN